MQIVFLFYVSTISSAKHNDVFKAAIQLMFALWKKKNYDSY